MLPSDDAV